MLFRNFINREEFKNCPFFTYFVENRKIFFLNAPLAGKEKKRKEEDSMNKTIITVIGKDNVGIIAKICTYLANNNINILDINQTIVQDYFNMMMIVDLEKSAKAFQDCSKELSQIGDEIGVTIRCQREEIFNMMHRI